MTTRYQLRLRDTSGNLVAVFDDAGGFLSLNLTQRVNGIGLLTSTFRGTDERTDLFQPDCIIEVWRTNADYSVPWYREWAGFHRTPVVNVDVNGQVVFMSYASGFLSLLDRRIVAYKSGSDGASKSGVSETVMKAWVEENAGPSALASNGRLADGAFPGFTVQADSANGGIYAAARAFDNLLQVVGDIGVLAGIDFDVAYEPGPDFEFQTFYPQRGSDRRMLSIGPDGRNASGEFPVLFREDTYTMANPVLSAPRSQEVSKVYVLGRGEGANRSVVVRDNADALAVSPWNQIEVSRQGSQTDDDQLSDIGDQLLAGAAVVQKLNFDTVPQPTLFYGKHYFLGDLISSVFQGTLYHKKVEQITIDFDPTNAAENIKAEFGEI
jgi:hypothetical protein